jgi:hypothetical protein
MNQSNKKNSLEEILRDTQHNKKLKEIFLKLLAKQKSKHRDWSNVRSKTLPGDKSEVN